MPDLQQMQHMLSIISEQYKNNISEMSYSLFLKDIQFKSYDGVNVTLTTPNLMTKESFENQFAKYYATNFSSLLKHEVGILVDSIQTEDLTKFVYVPDPKTGVPQLQIVNVDDPRYQAPEMQVKLKPTTEETLNPNLQNDNDTQGLYDDDQPPLIYDTSFKGEYDYTFDSFVVGNCNRIAYRASEAVANEPAKDYNPLLFYGRSGLGKTHLMRAVCDHIAKTKPHFKIKYVTSEEFTNDLIDHIGRKDMSQFQQKYRTVDVLAIDDIQFIAGKERTQEEFFHTFNDLFENGKQILLTSDRPPKDIKTLEERLRTRFEKGLPVDIQPPDFETRVAIIKQKCHHLGFTLQESMIDYIAKTLEDNVRQIEGVINKLKALHQLGDMPLSLHIVKFTVDAVRSNHLSVDETLANIIGQVARNYKVNEQDLKGSSRKKEVANARHICMYIIRAMTELSFKEIGEFIGGRDHSTVMNSYNKIADKMSEDAAYRNTINDLIDNIKSLDTY